MTFDEAKYNEEACERLQIEAETRLGRPLTSDEEYGLWNPGPFIGMQPIHRAIMRAQSASEVEKVLASLPRGTPVDIREFARKLRRHH